MNSALLLQLLVVHVIGDFLLQPGNWIQSRNERHFRSPYLYLHSLIHFLLALLVTGISGWWAALIIASGHFLFDGLKSWMKRKDLAAFITDQSLHLLVIGLVFSALTGFNWYGAIQALFQSSTFWIYTLAYLTVLFVYPHLIQMATQHWRKDIPEEREKLLKAGRWIGIIERTLILSFMLIDQFGAIGFLLAAKSVLRFGDLREARDKGHTEYVLIGTLLSFGLTIITGIVTRYGITHTP